MSACGFLFAFAIYGVTQQIGGHTLLLILATVVSGLVASSRLALQEHTHKQVYVGFFVGVAALPLAMLIVKIITS